VIRRLVAAATLLAGLPWTADAGPIETSARPERRSHEALVTAAEPVVCVGRRFVDASADSVVLDGRTLVRGVDYRLDAVQGCWFLAPTAFPESLAAPIRVVVWYRPLPFALSPVYARRDLSGGTAPVPGEPGAPGTGAGADSDPAAPARDSSSPAVTSPGDARPAPGFPVRPSLDRPDDAEGRPDLDLTGSKTFTVDLGTNRDLSLQQTLDMRITGPVSRDVTLRAILSDRDLPFQPEGSTAELEELDKVLIEVEAPNARIGLGDRDLAVSGGQFARFARRLQGLEAEVRRGDDGRGRFVGAAQRGEFRSFEFLGTEGKQGPYPLVDRTGNRGIVVVAGSERVWVDGEPLLRGLDNDYIIDYSRAELTFTAKRPMTARSRVAVDYEFAAGGYRKSLYLAESRGRAAAGGLEAGFVLARESDDRDRPLGGELSDAERARLAAAGDSALSGGGGVRFVGDGRGRYADAFDAVNSRSYYRYVGFGQGRYEIDFVRIGPGLGDYADSLAGQDTVYVYRGPSAGEFAPAGALVAPSTQSLGQLDVAWSLGDRGRASGEFALSGRDLNTLSPLDDDDNAGRAGRLELALEPLALSAFGRGLGDLALDLDYRSLSESFTALGRLDASFLYDRDWNLPGRGAGTAETRRSGTLRYRPVPALRLSAERAGLSGGGRDADRTLYGAELSGRVTGAATLLLVDSALDTGRVEGRLDRRTAAARTTVGRFTPGVRYEREERTEPVAGRGTRYETAGGDLAVRGPGPVRLSMGLDRRIDDAREDGAVRFARDTRAWTRRAALDLEGMRALSASLLYQSRDVDLADGGTTRSDLARLDLSRRSADAAFAADFHYQVGTNGVERRSRTLQFVGEGMGNYDAFGNLFPGGGYELLEGPLGEEELITDVDVSLRLELIPYRAREGGGTVGWLRRNVGWDGSVRVEERSTLPLGSPSRIFDFDAYQKPDVSLGGRIQLRQRVELFPASRTASIQLTEDLDDVANYQFTNFREDRTEHLVGVGVRWSPSTPWTAELTRRGGRRSQTVSSGEDVGRRRRAGVAETSGQVTWRPRTNARLVAAAVWRTESESDDVGARAFELNPRASWFVGSRGRLELTGRWIAAERRGGYTGVGGFSTLSLQDRLEVGVDGDWRLLEVLTVGAGLSGRRPERGDLIVDGRMEVRAYF
jgi:hypothetical protein